MDDSTHGEGIQKAYHWKGCLEIGHMGFNRNTASRVGVLNMLVFANETLHYIFVPKN